MVKSYSFYSESGIASTLRRYSIAFSGHIIIITFVDIPLNNNIWRFCSPAINVPCLSCFLTVIFATNGDSWVCYSKRVGWRERERVCVCVCASMCVCVCLHSVDI